jgi:hypothetical protein
MKVSQLLSDFYEAIEGDARVRSTHISLYFALLQKWKASGETNPMTIVREEIMKMAKISARHTYNKCMHELHQFGYIRYIPSCNPFLGSIVYLDLSQESRA